MGGRACVPRGDVLLRQRGQILAHAGAREPSCHCRPTAPAHAVALGPRAPFAPAGVWGSKGGQQRAPGGKVNPRRFGVPGKSGDATPKPLDEGVETGRPARGALGTGLGQALAAAVRTYSCWGLRSWADTLLLCLPCSSGLSCGLGVSGGWGILGSGGPKCCQGSEGGRKKSDCKQRGCFPGALRQRGPPAPMLRQQEISSQELVLTTAPPAAPSLPVPWASAEQLPRLDGEAPRLAPRASFPNKSLT